MSTALLIVARAANIGASVLIAGSFTFDVVALRSAPMSVHNDFAGVERFLFRMALWSLIVALISAVLWFCVVAANMSGLPFTSGFSTATWRTVLLQTQFGHIWQIRIAVIAAALLLVISALTRSGSQPRSVAFALSLLSLVLLVSIAWISHAAAARAQPLGLMGDAIHLCAAGVWVGGLVPVAIFLGRARRWLSSDQETAKVIERFSTLSLCCVTILVVTGISNSWLLVGSIHALITTVYGRLLLLKLALFAILIGFGASNRLAIKSIRLRPETRWDLLPRLRRNVICEASFAAAVVAIIACLGVTPPAQHP